MVAFLIWVLATLVGLALVIWLAETFPLPLSPVARWFLRAVVVIVALIFLFAYVLPLAGAPHLPR